MTSAASDKPPAVDDVDDQEVDMESEGDDDKELFAPVMASLRLDLLPGYASAAREKINQDSNKKSHEIEPVTIGLPICGSYHVLFPVEFNDGIRWILKVPVNGTRDRFDGPAARALCSEALTMQLLRHKTTIPLPRVFAFDATCGNDLGCPFILMSFISGKSLYDCWFDHTVPKHIVQARRTRTLKELAAAMIQLDRFSFDQGGSINFDEHGQPARISPSRHVDNQAMLDRLYTDDQDEMAVYVELGPFTDPRSFYTAFLDCRHEPRTISSKGELELLRLFLHWVPEPMDERKKFVLTHPDFDIQNVIVSEDGGLQGLIDWDGVCAVPRSLGNEKYPSWLTRDWDPAMYGWKEEMEQGIEPEGVWEDSPETLAFYRTIYDDFMKAYRLQDKGLVSEVNLTRNSLFAENLYIAATDQLCTASILDKFFNEIAEIVRKYVSVLATEASKSTDEENEKIIPLDNGQVSGQQSGHGNMGNGEDNCGLNDFYIYKIACAMAEGHLNEWHMKLLKIGFDALLKGEIELQEAKPCKS
ncbi:uncharacterized protein BP5553_01600 [Venustampulla echinocandica]|uniref:Aminoglycoside phosphotransferase domain-containing protein n=1 Tax=Venustampulla echinocandica TaxID=2656787 RepID=A0A370U1G8_9HELO|nr:uncharacterized protein BP5553_01600 [Venustampulla echinocandica]RDL41621.1 hypothetical protein BP5553_01600 [Venustampulla echinocandica]